MTSISNSNNVSQSLLDNVNGVKNASKSTAAAAQDRFMTLLVTQMKNQDPLNPMDNAQVTSQLAQLSTVTGIDKLNATLEAMMSSTQSNQAMQAANLIGHSALVAGNTVNFNGTAGNFGVELPAGADAVNITISDSAGNKLRQISLGKQTQGILPLSWDGYTDTGSRVANGEYKISITAKAGGSDATANILSLQQINSVTTSASGVKLNLSNASSVTTADLKQIF